MKRPTPTLEDRVEFARDALEARHCELEAELCTARPERAAEIGVELDAIRQRLECLITAAIHDATELGEPLPSGIRVRTLLTADGIRIEPIDTGKRITCRYWREGDERPERAQITMEAGPYLPCINIRLEQVEHSAWCLALGWDR